MKLLLQWTRLTPGRSVVLPADLEPAAVATAADRLRSWAAIRDEQVTGHPFIRLHGDFVSFVHVPVSGTTLPHPETGISVETTRESPAISVADVHFGDIRAVVRALNSEFSTRPGFRITGPAAYVSADGRTFARGTILFPLEGPETDVPESISLLDQPGIHEQGPARRPVDDAIRVVTVARQVGTEGDAIARLVARELGWDYYDYNIVMAAADEAGVNPETVERAIQRRPLADRVLETLSGGALSYGEYTWVAPVPIRSSPMMTSEEFRRLVEDVIEDLAARGDAVIVGHGGQFALRDRSDTLRVLVTGSPDRRTDRIVANMGLSRQDADALVESTDEERIGYFRTMHEGDWLDPAAYDLCLNTDRTSARRAAGAILYLVRSSREAPPAE